MQKTILLVALIIATSLSIFGQMNDKQSSKMAKTEQEVMTLAIEFANSIVKSDVGAMERLLADDFMDVSPNGTMTSKSQFIAANKNPLPANAGKLEAIDVSESKVRVYGDAAVMTARTTLRGQTANGQAYNTVNATVAVFVKNNGRWQIAAVTVVPVPPPKPGP
jgi:ketosteroid isomerase-like protein